MRDIPKWAKKKWKKSLRENIYSLYMFIWYHKKSSINNDSTTVLLWFCGLSPISRQAHVARYDKLTPRTGRYRSPWPGFHQRTSSSPAVLHPKTSFAPVALRELHQLTFSWEKKGNQSKSYKYIYITYIINIIYIYILIPCRFPR